MSLSPAEVETIVRAVIQRLRTASAPTNVQSHALTLSEKLITLRTLEGRLQDVQTLKVPVSAVVTPAVRDELRDRNIRLDRITVTPRENSQAVASGLANSSLLLLADAPLTLHDPVFAEVVSGSGNFQSDSCRIAAHQSSGGQGSIWWSKSPFAALRGTVSNKLLRAVQLSTATDFDRAMAEADPNVLIVDATTWQAQHVVGLAKQWRAQQR